MPGADPGHVGLAGGCFAFSPEAGGPWGQQRGAGAGWGAERPVLPRRSLRALGVHSASAPPWQEERSTRPLNAALHFIPRWPEFGSLGRFLPGDRGGV